LELNKANVDKFYDLYGNKSLSWALDELLNQFILAHEVTPVELMAVGAKELKRIIAEKDNGSNRSNES
jgi:hypothetical protein